ncbi:hypothetical protein ACS0TY_010017 [Phlomoides rotata]
MKQMDDSAETGARLDVSVSFGRFENDALSWEKWSSFSQNKYMEEIGTLSTPGSVAQKKAYFEAHYKKIAAKKAEEELEQEKSMDPDKPSPDVSSKDDAFAKSSENGIEYGFSGGDRLVEEVAEEPCITALKNVAIVDEEEEDDARSSKGGEHEACTNGFVDAETLEVEIVQSECSAVEEAKDVVNVNVDNPELDFRNEQVLVGLEAPQKDSQRILDEPPKRKNGVKQASVMKKEIPKLNARSIASKVTPTKKEKVLSGTKKKVVSPAVKPLQASTPKNAKPTSVSTPVSASQSSKKKVNASAPPKSKSSLMRESKRAAPTSLHMSLSLGPSDSFGALPMTRKSLIMESMGDKDIVRRAFKTFQNRSNGSINDGKPSTVKNVSSTAFEPKMSSYHTPTKGNEGLSKDAEKRLNQRSQSGSRSNPLPSVSHKSSSVAKKSPMPILPATSLRSDDKAVKRKEFLKKLEAKSIARMAENAQPGARSTVSVENGFRQ